MEVAARRASLTVSEWSRLGLVTLAAQSAAKRR